MDNIAIHEILVKPDECSIVQDDKITKLPRLTFELLMFFINNPRQIHSIEEISHSVWKTTVVSNETVIQRITLLRKALGDDIKSPAYIESVRGQGYRLIVTPEVCGKLQSSSRLPIAICVCLAIFIPLFYAVYNAESDSANAGNANTDIHSSPQTTELLLKRANYYYQVSQKNNIDSAISLFSEVLELEPLNVDALLGLSLSLSKSVCQFNQPVANAKKAREKALLALQQNRYPSRVHAAIAYSYDCMGFLEKALKHYQLSIEFDDKNAKSISSAAYLLETKGKLLQAFILNQKAKTLRPDNPLTNLQIARIWELLGFTESAQNLYHRLFILFPDNVFVNEAYPRFLFQQGNFELSSRAFETALNRGIERRDIYLLYAELIWLTKSKQASLQWFEKAASLDVNEPHARTILNSVKGQLSEQDASNRLEVLISAITTGDSWPTNYLEASFIELSMMKNKTRAIEYLEKAVDLGFRNSEYLTFSPLFTELRSEPAFFNLISKINNERQREKNKYLAAYSLPEQGQAMDW